MATRTFDTTGNWSLATNWADDTKPVSGDDVIIADGVVCTIDEDTPNLNSIGTDEVTGTGRCLLSDGVTVNFPTGTMEAGACDANGFFRFEGTGTASCTINGTVKGGSGVSAHAARNQNSGTLYIEGDSLGGSNSGRGVVNASGGIVHIKGKSEGGTGSGSLSAGCQNLGAGIIHIYGKTIGTARIGCYISSASTGRVYFYDDLEDNVALAVQNDAGTNAYAFLGYGKKWYASDGTTEKSADWLITAEIENADDLQMIEDAGLMAGMFVQTEDIDLTGFPVAPATWTPIGTVAPFTGYYTGLDLGPSEQKTISNGTLAGAIFAAVGEEGEVRYCQLTGFVLATHAALVATNAGTVRRCFVRGTGSSADHVAEHLVATNNGLIRECYSRIVDGGILGVSGGGTGDIELCYHNIEDATNGVYISDANAKTRSYYQQWNFVTVWTIDGTINDGYPYLDKRSAPLRKFKGFKMSKQHNAAGHVIDDVQWFQPVAGSGDAHTATNSNTTVTVVPGQRYVIANISTDGSAHIGFATQATEANRLLVVAPGEKIGVSIPLGVTTLNFLRIGEADVSLYLVKAEG